MQYCNIENAFKKEQEEEEKEKQDILLEKEEEEDDWNYIFALKCLFEENKWIVLIYFFFVLHLNTFLIIALLIK